MPSCRSRRSAFRQALLPAALALAVCSSGAPAADAQPERYASWRARSGQVEELLRDGKYVRAARASRDVLDNMARHLAGADDDRDWLGGMLMLRAVAEAGYDDTDQARWSWSLAQSLAPALADVDLTRFGQPGGLLAANRLRPACTDGDLSADEEGEVRNLLELEPGVSEVPRPDRTPEPEYPAAARDAGIGGPVILQVIIDRRGRPTSPRVLDAPSPVLAYAAGEAVREWRFRPAAIRGREVAVCFNLRIDFNP